MASHIRRILGIIAVTFRRIANKKDNPDYLFGQTCDAADSTIHDPHAEQKSGGFARL
jgi:hypothetical protein